MALLNNALRRAIRSNVARREFSMLSTLEEFPGIPAISPLTSKATTAASVTTLPSGLTIITEDASPTTTVSLLYPSAGSSSELTSERGAALLNKCLAFKSASSLSSLLILRNLEDAGASPFSHVGRRGAGLGFTCPPEAASRLVPLLAGELSFEKWDVRDAKRTAEVCVEAAGGNGGMVLTERLYAAAYGMQSSLGRPLHVPCKEDGRAFRERGYTLGNAFLTATGTNHEDFVRTVENALPETRSPAEEGRATYMGGESRLFFEAAPRVALAFQVEATAAQRRVLKHSIALLSGLPSFESEGIIGLYGVGEKALDEMCLSLTTPLGEDLVQKAKGRARAEAVFGMQDGSRKLADAMTEAVMETGGFSVENVINGYHDMDVQVVLDLMGRALASNPAMAAVGDISNVPYHATLKARLS